VPWQRRPEVEARPEELLRRFSARIQQLAERARAAVRAAVPEALEQVRPNRGYFGYRLRHQFAFIEPQQDHVRVGFALGALLDDPAGLLQEELSRTVRYVRLERPADTRRAELASLLQRAAALHPPRRPPRGRVQLRRGERPLRRRPGRVSGK
jgi:hypothetical protein